MLTQQNNGGTSNNNVPPSSNSSSQLFNHFLDSSSSPATKREPTPPHSSSKQTAGVITHTNRQVTRLLFPLFLLFFCKMCEKQANVLASSAGLHVVGLVRPRFCFRPMRDGIRKHVRRESAVHRTPAYMCQHVPSRLLVLNRLKDLIKRKISTWRNEKPASRSLLSLETTGSD